MYVTMIVRLLISVLPTVSAPGMAEPGYPSPYQTLEHIIISSQVRFFFHVWVARFESILFSPNVSDAVVLFVKLHPNPHIGPSFH